MSLRRDVTIAVAGRAGSALVLIVLAVTLPRLLPGDPWTALWTPGASEYVFDEATREALRARYGLDRPLPIQVATEVGQLLRFDAGTSIQYGRPVSGLILERLPRTLLLVGVGSAVGIALGVAVGAAAGWRGGRGDRAGLLAVVALRSVPSFALASFALYLFAVRWALLPASGHRTPFADAGSPLDVLLDTARHLVLPAGVLAVLVGCGQFLVARAAVRAQRGEPYLLGAVARGADRRALLQRHVVPAALAPVLALAGIQVGLVVSGSVVVESVFSYPGLGLLLRDAVAFRDYPVLQAGFITTGLVVLLAALAADLATRQVDPAAPGPAR